MRARATTAAIAALLMAAAPLSTAQAASPSPLLAIARAAATPVLAPPGRNCVAAGDDIATLPTPQVRLSPERAWPTTRGAGVVVAILDSGVDPATPQLSGRVTVGLDAAVGKGTGAGDCLGEGTAMAGLVLASAAPGVGFHGVAPGALALPIRVTADSLQTTADVLARGINAAVLAGAGVVLVTVGTPVGSPALTRSLSAAEAAGVVIVAPAEPASGGKGWLAPGVYDSVLAVASVDASDSADDPDAALEAIADVAAPGEDVLTTLPGGGHTAAYSGVRPAAAYVAGVATLVRSQYPDLTAAQVRQRIELTADHPGRAIPDPAVGWGIVDPLAAVTAVIPAELSGSTAPASAVVVPPPTAPMAPDQTARDRALWLAGGLCGVALLLLLGRFIVPRGRARRWRSGSGAAPTR